MGWVSKTDLLGREVKYGLSLEIRFGGMGEERVEDVRMCRRYEGRRHLGSNRG